MTFYSLNLRRRATLIGAVFIVVLFGLLIYETPLASSRDYNLEPSPVTDDGPVRVEHEPLGLPSEYSLGPFDTPWCADRFGTPYLEHLRDSATEYCTPQSSSALTCFHVAVTSDSRTDTLCLGRNAVWDRASMKFQLGCELGDLSKPTASVQVPEYGRFQEYWYQTGPRPVFEFWVDLQNTLDGKPSKPENQSYTILIKREGSQNLWHCLMEMFSMTMSLDVLRSSPVPNDTRPFFTAADAANTQVVVLDERDDGPYFDLWSIFAKKPTVRIKDVPETTKFENIIVPLAGGSNPFWQGDWEIHSCEDSALLRTFARRVLDFYGLGAHQPRQSEEIVVTFINRTEGRRIIDQEKYLDKVQSTFEHVKLQSIDFAAISFRKQLEIIRDTDVLVGVHGAGLTHGMFLPPRSAMVEVLPPTVNHKGFRNIAGILQHSYYSAHGSEPPISKRGNWHREDIVLEEDKFMELMDIAVKVMYNKGQRSHDVV